MFCSSSKKVLESFTKITRIAATARITINKIRTDLLIKGTVSLNRNSVQSLYGDWKTTLRWQKLKLFRIDLTNLDLNCNNKCSTHINGSTHANSFLVGRACTFYL